MQLRIFTEPQQGATYDQLLAVAQGAERLGFDAFFRSDHYQRIGEGAPGPGSTDAWMTLAAIARETTRIRLGTLVTPVTFRFPGPLAIQVAQADAMSGGRVELGLGAGWYDGEHAAYAIPFPSTGDRFAMLEEQLEIVTGLWKTPVGEPYSFAGKHHSVVDSPALPKPVQQPRPADRHGRLGHEAHAAARGSLRGRVQHAVRAGVVLPRRLRPRARRVRDDRPRSGDDEVHGRDGRVRRARTKPSSAGARSRAARIPTQARAGAAGGTPDEVVERIHEFGREGAETVYLQYHTLDEPDHLELIGTEVLPKVGAAS